MGVAMDSQAVQDEVAEFMKARGQNQGNEQAAPQAQKAVVAENTTAEQEEEDGTFKSLVWAIMNCPTCKGKETVACFRTCRYGGALEEDKKERSWSECLNQCIENRWLRATFSAMLPRS